MRKIRFIRLAYHIFLFPAINVDELGPKLVLPHFNFLTCSIYDLNPVSQNLFVIEWEGNTLMRAADVFYKLLFAIVPKPDGEEQAELFIEQVLGEAPRDEQADTLRGACLARVGRPHMAAGQKVPIDPLLLYVEVILVASSSQGAQKEPRSYSVPRAD
jgi:hypothetical protein